MNYERNVLGLPQIPQQRTTDIYELEQRLDLLKMAKSVIVAELDWDDDEDDD